MGRGEGCCQGWVQGYGLKSDGCLPSTFLTPHPPPLRARPSSPTPSLTLTAHPPPSTPCPHPHPLPHPSPPTPHPIPLTETCAASFVDAEVWDGFFQTAGFPTAGTEFCLESLPEMGYNATADPPRGEILLRGPGVFAGYFKDQAKTAETFR